MDRTAALMQITPQQATEWLMHAPARRIENEKVERFAEDIRHGRWKVLNNESIKFRPNGVLEDGLDRLTACVRAKTPFYCWVVQLSTEDMKWIDSSTRKEP